MPISSRLFPAVAAALAACACAGAPLAEAQTTQTTFESVTAFEGQLNGHRVRAVTLRSKAHRLRVTLADGSKVTVTFPAAEEQRLLAAARARGITVKVVKVQPPPSHKRRDIAIAVAVVVVIALAIGAWLLVRRRRIREEQYGPGAGR